MPKKGKVEMSHSSVGSRRSRSPRDTVEAVEQAQEIVEGAQDVFAKLEQQKIEAEQEEEAERGPRLASFQDLVFLGKLQKTVEVAGWTFLIHTLTAKEQRELLSHIMALPADKRLIFAKPYTVWMALDLINDTPVEVAAQAAGFEDELEFVCSWQDPLVERLYNEYDSMLDESRAVFQTEKIEGDLKK
nr:hypothetical protein 96 [bacterium]